MEPLRGQAVRELLSSSGLMGSLEMRKHVHSLVWRGPCRVRKQRGTSGVAGSLKVSKRRCTPGLAGSLWGEGAALHSRSGEVLVG